MTVKWISRMGDNCMRDITFSMLCYALAMHRTRLVDAEVGEGFSIMKLTKEHNPEGLPYIDEGIQEVLYEVKT